MKVLNHQDYINLSENTKYHIMNRLTISESIFRIGSDAYLDLVNEIRELHFQGKILLSENDTFIVEKLQTGKKAIYKPRGEKTRQVELDSPKRGGNKKFIVYRDSKKRDEDGNIIAFKIEWGDPNLAVNNCDEKASKSFLARHKCSQKTDMDTPGWWACNVALFAKQLGLECDTPW